MALALLVNGIGWLAPAAADAPETARNSDLEPNDRYQDAVLLDGTSELQGSLLVEPASDTSDWYRVSVPAGQAIKASLTLLDYDFAQPAANDFTLNLTRVVDPYGYLTWVESSQTSACVEAVGALQLYSTNALSMYLSVTTKWNSASNPGTTPGRYSLKVEVFSPPVKGEEPVWGELGVKNCTSRADFYRLDPAPGETQSVKVRLQPPQNASFSIYVYGIWPYEPGKLVLRNWSWEVQPGAPKEAVVGGSEGSYYIAVKARSGEGTYSLGSEILQTHPDRDNTPGNATAVARSGSFAGRVDQALDWVDWYAVRVRAQRPIDVNLTIAPDPSLYTNIIDLKAYDESFQPLASGSGYTGMESPVSVCFNGLSAACNGTLYIAVRALPAYYPDYDPYSVSRASYNLSFTLPNEPPVLNDSLPRICMKEDSRDSSLALSEYIFDPDGNPLQYKVVGGPYHTRPTIEQAAGRVTFAPEANWHGKETVRFIATDTGPGRPNVEASAEIEVESVNDLPAARLSIDDMSVPEDEWAETPDLGTVFSDADDAFSSLIFRLNVLSSETSPPDNRLPVQFNSAARAFRLGPARGFFGTFRLEITCTDGWPGTVPAKAAFNLTVKHRNHSPDLREGVMDPTVVMVAEQGSVSRALADFFTDPDLAPDYANDTLRFDVSGMLKLDAWIEAGGRLVVNTRDVEYYPGANYEERLLVTARDRAGRAATLNLSVLVVPVDDAPRIVDCLPDDAECSAIEGRKSTFKVTAADNDTGELAYSWYFDGQLVKGAQGNIYGFLPGYDLGGTVHAIRVEVSDGPNMVSFEWQVRVVDQNRLPGGFIRNPLNMSRYEQGTEVIFTAEGQDEDGDALTFIWRGPTGEEMGRGATIKYARLPRGTITVRLEINDTKGSTFQEVVLVVTKATEPARAPGFDGAFAMAATGIVLLLGAIRKLRQRA
jgi:hypothetical protein